MRGNLHTFAKVFSRNAKSVILCDVIGLRDDGSGNENMMKVVSVYIVTIIKYVCV